MANVAQNDKVMEMTCKYLHWDEEPEGGGDYSCEVGLRTGEEKCNNPGGCARYREFEGFIISI